MITIKQFADKRGINVSTIYSWIRRKQTERNGFTTIKIGSVTMIEESKSKKSKITT